MSSLLHKDSGFWVEELIRLGVFEKVELMAKEPSVPSISSCSMANLSEIRDSIDEMNARNNTLSRFEVNICLLIWTKFSGQLRPHHQWLSNQILKEQHQGLMKEIEDKCLMFPFL